MGLPGATELLIVLGIVVIIFGGKKIPELMKGVGSGIKNFKSAVKDDETTVASEDKKPEEIQNSTANNTTAQEAEKEPAKQA